MPYKTYNQYLIASHALRSKDWQYQRNLTIYPHLKKSGRDKLDRFFKQLYNRLVKRDSQPTPREQALAIAKRFTNSG